MQLRVNGFCYRTSGSSAPFDEKAQIFGDVMTLIGRTEPLPWPDCSFRVNRVGGGIVEIGFLLEGREQTGRLEEGGMLTFRAERNILAVEVTFSMHQ